MLYLYNHHDEASVYPVVKEIETNVQLYKSVQLLHGNAAQERELLTCSFVLQGLNAQSCSQQDIPFLCNLNTRLLVVCMP